MDFKNSHQASRRGIYRDQVISACSNIRDTVRVLINDGELASYDLDFLVNRSFGRWCLEEDTCRYIGRICEILRPRRVLEFGSGLSTLLLMHEIKRGNVEEVWSIDHLDDFPGHPGQEIKQAEMSSKIHLLHCPIQLGFYGGKLFHFYRIHRKIFEDMKPIDLVIIDGPPYYFESREAAIYASYPVLSTHALILLDDASRRNREQIYLRNWHRYFGENIESILYDSEFKKGLACIWLTGKRSKIIPFPLLERIGALLYASWIGALRFRRYLSEVLLSIKTRFA